MLNPTSLLADALGRNLAETYRRIFGDREPHFASGLDEAARLVIERIASSDALYHDCQHTALVTLCVQDILRGRRLERVVTPSDWPTRSWRRWPTTSGMCAACASATRPSTSSSTPPATR
jgi:hypothetical protein